jgi:hypothetical protein
VRTFGVPSAPIPFIQFVSRKPGLPEKPVIPCRSMQALGIRHERPNTEDLLLSPRTCTCSLGALRYPLLDDFSTLSGGGDGESTAQPRRRPRVESGLVVLREPSLRLRLPNAVPLTPIGTR